MTSSSAARSASGSPNPTEPEGPAKVTGRHIFERPAMDDNMRPITGKVACSVITPLYAAYRNGKLQGGDPKYTPLQRLQAGETYEKFWDTAQSPGRDSTQALNISRGSQGTTLSEAQSESVKALVAIESHLSQRDRTIIRKVCGMGCFPSEAVAAVSADYVKSTSARFRESLDALIEAIGKWQKHPNRFGL